MAIRFQSLLDSQTSFKVKESNLNQSEKDFMSEYIRTPNVHYFFIDCSYVHMVVTQMPSLEFDLNYFNLHRFQEFIPVHEPILSNRQVFVMFLKRHRLYAAFKRNYARYEYTQYDSLVKNYLIHAYGWSGTPEGSDVWKPLHRKWLAMVADLKLTGRD